MLRTPPPHSVTEVQSFQRLAGLCIDHSLPYEGEFWAVTETGVYLVAWNSRVTNQDGFDTWTPVGGPDDFETRRDGILCWSDHEDAARKAFADYQAEYV